MTVDTRNFLNGTGSDVPNVEVTASGTEEDSSVCWRRMERRCGERCTLHVERGEEWIRIKGIGIDVVQRECRARAGGEEERIRRVEGK